MKSTLSQKIKNLIVPRDTAVLYLVLAGISLWVLSIIMSYFASNLIMEGEDWRGFFEKPNWFLFPLFLIALGRLTVGCMEHFRRAWHSLVQNSVLFIRKTSEEHACTTKEVIEIEKRTYARWNLKIIWISLSFGLILSFSESLTTAAFHFRSLCNLPLETMMDCKTASRSMVMSPDCHSVHLTSPVSWQEFMCGDRICFVEKDFSVSNSNGSNPHSKKAYVVSLLIFTQLMQGVLICIAFILLIQIAINVFCFGHMSLFPFKNSQCLGIKLNVRDQMGEFGLASWNSAINFMLFVIAISMAIPILSAASQPPNSRDFGQVLLLYILPLILLIPILSSFFIRVTLHSRLKENFHQLTVSEKTAFACQEIWPFNRNVVSKTLMAILFAEYYWLWSGKVDFSRLLN